MSLSGIAFLDIARYWSRSPFEPTPPPFGAPLGVIPLEIRQDFWLQKTRVPGLSYDVVCVILGLAIFVELRLVTYNQKDGHNDSICRARIASRGKNK